MYICIYICIMYICVYKYMLYVICYMCISICYMSYVLYLNRALLLELIPMVSPCLLSSHALLCIAPRAKEEVYG